MAYFLYFHIRPTTITDLKITHSSDSGIKTLSDCTLENDYYYGDGFDWNWHDGTVTFESTGYITQSIEVQTDEGYDVTLVADPTYTPPSSEKPSKIYGWTQNGTTYYTSEEDPTTASKIYNNSGDVQSKAISARVSETLYAWKNSDAQIIYTKTASPTIGTKIYNSNGEQLSGSVHKGGSSYIQIGVDADTVYYRDDSSDIISNYITIDGTNYTRNSSADITLDSEDPDPTPTPGGKMINVRHVQKTDTSANWATSTLVLLEGEIAYASDTGEIRIGDGKKAWKNLTTYVPKMGLNALNDTTITNPATGNVLKYNGTTWVNESLSGAAIPAGSIISYAGTTAPDGYLICDGSAVSRTTYAALFSAIGTAWGDGDGNSTFNIPNATDKTLWGTTAPGYLSEQLPNITGEFIAGSLTGFAGTGTGALYLSGTDATRSGVESGAGRNSHLGFDASKSSSTYTADGVVRPNSVAILMCIRY